jgi:hypothetical protein
MLILLLLLTTMVLMVVLRLWLLNLDDVQAERLMRASGYVGCKAKGRAKSFCCCASGWWEG